MQERLKQLTPRHAASKSNAWSTAARYFEYEQAADPVGLKLIPTRASRKVCRSSPLLGTDKDRSA